MRNLIAFLLGAAIFAGWALTPSPPPDLRNFDPDAVAAAETAMWKSYYDKERLRLFSQLVVLLREQYHRPAPDAVVTAYHAARAAARFQPGRNRADYETALPDLVQYYRRLLPGEADAARAARLELEWWIRHRERDPKLAEALAELQAALYARPSGDFQEHARLRAEAMTLRDEGGDWQRIADLLRLSWRSLHAAVNRA